MTSINRNNQKGLLNMVFMRRTPLVILFTLILSGILTFLPGKEAVAQSTSGDGLLGEYYDGTNFNVFAFDRLDSTINFNWGNGSPDSTLLAPDTFSIRWTGYLLPTTTETYQFCTSSDDGIRLWLDDTLVISNWTVHAPRTDCGSFDLEAGVAVPIRLEFFENGGQAVIRLYWSSPTLSQQIVPQTALYSQSNIIDTDGDGISNDDETSGILNTAYNNDPTLPDNPDSDNDNLSDGHEILVSGTDPNDEDTDGDGDLDGTDNCPRDINPDQADGDSDGLGDACEAGPIYPPNSTISVDSETATADGTDTITLTITLRDADNEVMDNVPVEISASSPFAIIDAPSGTTDANGVYETTIANTIAESVPLTIDTGDSESAFVGEASFIQSITFIGPDMAVSVTALDTIIAGQTLIYVVDVENLGTLPVSNVNVFAGVPLGTATIESVVTPEGVTLDQQGINSVSWLIPSLQATDSFQFIVYARSAANLQLGNQIPLTALVDAANDHDPNNNTASDSTRIAIASAPQGDPQAEKLDVEYTSSVASAAIGETVTMTVDVTNVTVDETLYNVEGFAALKDTFANQFMAASILTFTWPDPEEPGTLLPGETATATFEYVMTDAYHHTGDSVRSVRISADDADPTDGDTYVAKYDLLSYFDGQAHTDLVISGPGPQVQLLADRSTAYAGDTVNFTVRILNQDSYSDSLSNLVVTDLLNGQTLTLSSSDPVELGETVTAEFSYVVQESDVPLLPAIVTVEGVGTVSGIIVETSVQRNISVTSLVNSAVDLSLEQNDIQSLLFKDVPFNLPLRLINNGTLASDGTQIRVTLPLNVQVIDAGTATYNTQTRTLTWDVNDLNPGSFTDIAPQLQTNANVGETLSLTVTASNTEGDSNYSDNTQTISLPVVQPSPASASLVPVDREWVVGDGQDTISYIVTMNDQLGRPYNGVSGLVSSNGGSLIFPSTTFDIVQNGQAVIEIKSESPGVDIAFVDFGAGVTASASIQVRPDSLVLDPRNTTFGVGGQGRIDVELTNTSAQGDSFSFDVTGLEALDPSWISFTSEPLLLGSGQTGETRLQVSVPGTSENCALVGTYPITVIAYDSQSNPIDTATETFTIESTAPEVEQMRPFDGATIGSADVVFSWRSNTTGAATIYYKADGAPTYQSQTMTANPADPTYYSVSVNLPSIGDYEWYGTFDNGCGVQTTATQTFTYTAEILFVDRSYTYTVYDDYDLRYDINDNPLYVTVRNDSTETRDITVSLDNPYEDLIIGFIGAGSVDSYLTLQPGQSTNLNLRVFTQETLQSDYAITLNLSSPDTDATDSVPLTISVQPSIVFDVAITNAYVDTRNLVTEATLVNNGSTLTDLDLQVIDADTGLPADFVILPDIDHAYLPEGEAIPIEIIPLSIMDSVVSENYVIRATARSGVIEDVPITQADLSSYDLTQVCMVERPIAQTCTSAPGSITFESGGWYCTNRPNIDITVPWTLNSQVPITSIQAGMYFEGQSAYSHSTELFFNNVSIGGGIVPDEPSFNFNVPISSVIEGANYQTLNLRSLHTNGGHYIVGSNAYITVNYGQYERTACYSEEELQDAEIFPCGDQGDCQADITASQVHMERNGNDIALTVRIGNGGTVFVNDDVQVSFYDGNPEGGGNLITTTSISQALNPGEYEDIVVNLPIDSTIALPLYIVADDAGNLSGSYPESDESNNIYNTGLSLSPDLTVNSINLSGVAVDENSLVANGIISAQIMSSVQVTGTFDVTFFEDINRNGTYDAGDNTLITTTRTGLSAGTPTTVSAMLSDVLLFSNSPISAYVDSGDSIIETDETNNISISVICVATDGCESAMPDLTASYLRRSDNGSTVTLTVRIGNGGGDTVPSGVSVAFYDGDPANAGTLQIGTVMTTQALAMGEYQDVSVDVQNTVDALPVWVVADNTENYSELDELNNVYRSNIYVTDAANIAPVVVLDGDMTIVEGEDVTDGRQTLDAIVVDDVLPAGIVTTQWEVVGGDDTVFFMPVDAVDTTVTFTEAGIYTLRLTASDGELSAYDEIVIDYQVPPPPPPPNYTLDINGCIAAPTHADSVRGLVNIETTALTNLENAAVYYWPATDPQAYQSIATNLTINGAQIAAVFDTTVIPNDTYGVQLVGTDAITDEEVVCGIGLFVTGDYKPGRVVLSTTDFTIPLAGLPITVGRTYDSLERDIHSDFGYGWALALGNPRLEIDDEENITLTLPNGQRKTFYWNPIPYPIGGFVRPNYQSEAGEYGTLSTNGCALITSGICFPGPNYSETVTEITYSDPYGREFTYGDDGTLISITDLNNNVLEFEDDGIYSNYLGPNGELTRLVTIQRDPDNGNRIVYIEDNLNNRYDYIYDSNGDLVEVVMPDTATTADPTVQYQYYTEADGLAHFFKGGTDPLGNPVVATTYDSDGRLETVRDAENNITTYEYDVENQTTIVTNPDGTEMTMTYDEWGNLEQEIDELDRITNYDYDTESGNNNLLSVTNNAGETTEYEYDPDGNRTSVTNGEGITVISASYNQYGAPEQLTDANGIARTIDYDSSGLPSTASDPVGTLGSYTWAPQGSPLTVTDALGNVTTYEYDDYGNVITQTSPTTDAGTNVTYFTYDDMGRRLTAENSDGTFTRTEYDAIGNVIRVKTFEDDSETVLLGYMSYTYDANDNRTSATTHATSADDHPDDRTTYYVYDNSSRVVQVINPDDSYSTTTYDWRGNVTVRATYPAYGGNPTPLNRTCYIYDEAGQLSDVTVNCTDGDSNVPVTFVPLTTHYEYDAAGRRSHTFEAWDSVSETGILVSYVEYDDAGRVVRTADAAEMGAQGIVNWEAIADGDLDPDVIATRYTYDDAGQLLTVTDELGRTTTYVYDERGRRVRTIYADGTFTGTEYDLLGRVIRQTNAGGYQSTYTYNQIGNLVSQTVAANTGVAQTSSFEYDILGRRILSTNAAGETMQYVYDDLGRVDGICDASVAAGNCNSGNFTTDYSYNIFGEQIAVTDANGNTTQYDYDEMGRPSQITYADNSIETISYNSRGQRLVTSYAGYQTAYFYDDMGRLLGVCDAEHFTTHSVCNETSGFTTTYEYDSRGRQISTTNELDVTTRMVYDDANRLVLQIANFNPASYADPLNWSFDDTEQYWTDGTDEIIHGSDNVTNIITAYEYDEIGRRSLVRDVDGNETLYTYQNNTNRLESTTNPDGTTVSYSYDDLGRRTAMTDAEGISTSYEYDPSGRLTSVTNGEDETVSYSYDDVGRILSITNGRGNRIRSFAYDGQGRLQYECDADISILSDCNSNNYEVQYQYDPNGNLTDEIWTDGTHNEFAYDEMNRLIHEIYGSNIPSTQVEYSYSYNTRGMLEDVYDIAPDLVVEGTTIPLTTYTYDANGNPDTIEHSDGQLVGYGYDTLGRRTSVETVVNSVPQTSATYAYDDMNRVISVTDENTATTEFSYNPMGQLTLIERPNNVDTTYIYGDTGIPVDANRDQNPYQVYSIVHENTETTPVAIGQYDYQYDAAGNRTQMLVTASDSSQTTHDYEYDRAYRLTGESYNTGLADVTTRYEYDRAGNRTRLIDPSGEVTSYEYDANNQLISITKPDYYYEDYEYDERGNLTQVHAFGHGAETYTHYAYNARDQLVSYELSALQNPSTPDVTYAYDHRDNRVDQTIGTTTTDYLWDEFSHYGDVLLETTPTDTRGYTLAMGMLVSQTTNTNNTSYFLQDAQNSTVALADGGTGAVTSSYSYDAFGNLDDGATLETNYLYTGQQYDATTELYSLRARYYDTEIGRFLTRDNWAYNLENPIELNRYVYVANNPVTFSDPSGYLLAGFVKQIKARVAAMGGVRSAFVQPFISGAISAFIGYNVGTLFGVSLKALFLNIFGPPVEIETIFSETYSSGAWQWGLGLAVITGGMIGVYQQYKRFSLSEKFMSFERVLRVSPEKRQRFNSVVHSYIRNWRGQIFDMVFRVTGTMNAVAALVAHNMSESKWHIKIAELITDILVGTLAAFATAALSIPINYHNLTLELDRAKEFFDGLQSGPTFSQALKFIWESAAAGWVDGIIQSSVVTLDEIVAFD